MEIIWKKICTFASRFVTFSLLLHDHEKLNDTAIGNQDCMGLEFFTQLIEIQHIYWISIQGWGQCHSLCNYGRQRRLSLWVSDARVHVFNES